MSWFSAFFWLGFISGIGAISFFMIARERMPRVKHDYPKPIYFVKHPDGSFSEADPQP